MNPFKRLAEFIEDWRYLIKRDGVRLVTREIATDIVRLPFRHLQFKILEYPLSDPLPEIAPKIDLVIRPFEFNDLEKVKNLNRPSEAKQCERHLNNGHRGLVATYQGEVAGYAWGGPEMKPKLEKIPVQLSPGDVLCTDVFTVPSFRRKGIQTALSLARFQLFKELGFQNAVCYIEARNTPSLVVWQKKLGAKITGKIDFLRILSWYRIRLMD